VTQRVLPRRIPILYVVLAVLVLLSVVPLLFYSRAVSSKNRLELERNEYLLQSTITRSVAQEIRSYRRNLLTQIESLLRMIETSGAIEDVGDPRQEKTLFSGASWIGRRKRPTRECNFMAAQ
jgi:hypothetical protein